MTLPGPTSPLAQGRVAVELMHAPAEGLRHLHDEYGAVAEFGYRPFKYVALFGPDANRYVLADHPENFLWRDALASLIAVDGDTALVVSDGDEHRRRRRLVQPAFGTRQIHGYLRIMTDEIDRELDGWMPGLQLDVFVALRRVVRRIAVRSLFGDALATRADELGDALSAAVDFVNLPITSQIKLDLPWTRWHRAKTARDRADRIVNAEIARRRRDGVREASPDVLDSLLSERDEESGTGLSDVEIRDQVVSLVAAGYDTTSAAAAWAVHELLVNDGEWKRAAEEVHDVVGAERLTSEHLSRLPYVDAVVNETLRLWPPGWVSARRAIETFEFAGATIRRGSTVLYSPYVTHRMPELWPEPDRFRPGRWLGLEPAPYSYVPFGGGYRRCIGFAFATQELKVILVELLRRTRLERVPGPVTPTGSAALHPKEGIPVVVLDPQPGRVAVVAYAPVVATASPSPTPNPNAMKFTLDVTLASTMSVSNAQDAAGNDFAAAVFDAGGVASLFGVNDFVTVTREPDADWEPIIAAVQAAAAAHL